MGMQKTESALRTYFGKFMNKGYSLLSYANPFRNFKTKYVTLIQLEKDAQQEIGILAAQMSSRMDRFMWERYQQVILFTAGFHSIEYDTLKPALDLLYHQYTIYSFFGVANMSGIVVASGKGLLENVSVKARPWFTGAQHGPYVGDVHLAALLQSILGGTEILRFVDVAAPIKDLNNNTIGVLGAHLSWNWAKELAESVINQDDIDMHRELFITSSDSTVILTPEGYPFNATQPYQLNFTNYPEINTDTGYGIMQTKWPVSKDGEKGTDYIVGVSEAHGYDDFPGLGWRVFLRQPKHVAYAKAMAMYYLIIISGVCMMVVFVGAAIVLSWQITKPIMDVVKAADGILARMAENQDEEIRPQDVQLAARRSVGSEVKVLFNSLQSLVSALDEQAQLMMLNTQLQADVMDYTAKLVKSTADLEHEKTDKALVQGILFNVLPGAVAERLKLGERVLADNYSDLTVFFSDIVGFTPLCEKLTPVQVVMFLDDIFSRMDSLTTEFEMDRIRTIGDSYFAVGGMKTTAMSQQYHTVQVLCFAYCVLKLLDEFNKEHSLEGIQLQFRMGVHCGACVGSVIGTKQISFDLWGDSINVASRMESTGRAGRVQVSSQVYERTKHFFNYEKWDEHEVKGRGMMVTYFLEGPRTDLTVSCPPIERINAIRTGLNVSRVNSALSMRSLSLKNISIQMPP